MTYFSKRPLDKYYTPFTAATEFIQTTFNILSAETITETIEPSAGDGSFSRQLDCLAYDLEPEGEGITKQDFLTLPLEYKEGRLFIGNPPFGKSSHLLKKFIERSAAFGDYIAYICNSSFLKWDIPGFDLLYSERFVMDYSGVKVETVFNVWKRNPKKEEKKSIVEEYRSIQRQKGGVTKGIPENLNEYILLGAFGRGAMGRITTDPYRWCSIGAIKVKADRDHFCKWVEANQKIFVQYRTLTPTILNNIINHYYLKEEN